jgi:hypothetical protein
MQLTLLRSAAVSALALGFWLAPGCGGPRQQRATDEPDGPRTAWKGDAAPTSQAFPVAPPYLFAGERMIYRVEIHGIEVAEYSVAVGQAGDVDGRRTVAAEARIRAAGLAATLKSIDNVFTSWIDAATGRPFRFLSIEHEGDDYEKVDARFATGGFPLEVTVGSKAPVQEQQVLGKGEDAYDLNSMLFALRGWDAPEKTRTTVHVLRSRYIWRMQVEVGAYEVVSTELGQVGAIRYDAQTRRVTRKLEVDPAAGDRYYSLWITDDEQRLPVLMVAHTDYGDLRLEIVEYDAGSGKRVARRGWLSGSRTGTAPATATP